MLHGKKIILGVCGSIAAYKSALLVRLLVKEGAEVKVVMTASASFFITPLTLATLSKNEVKINLVDETAQTWTNHVELALWADLIVIAPASAHTIGKMAHGICDNLLLSVYLSAKCPVIVCPAMDLDMFVHPSTQLNLSTLEKFGNKIIQPEKGELASGLVGQGRMAEPENILSYLITHSRKNSSLQNKNILITAGPTYEPIDPVRFIGNHSSGKMGYRLAQVAIERGANVTLISGPTHLEKPAFLKEFIQVSTAEEMYQAVMGKFKENEILIMAAAVADYTPKQKLKEKMKKKDTDFSLELIKTTDIAAEIGKLKSDEQILVGFALESQKELENATAKMVNKNFDFIVLNSIREEGAGFMHNTNKITIIKKDQSILPFDLKEKYEVAGDILDVITGSIHIK